MNLMAAVTIYAGGPGSGCQGENCGRPKGYREGIVLTKDDVETDKNTFYHGTTDENLRSIIKNGLKPAGGKETEKGVSEKNVVYLSKSPWEAAQHAITNRHGAGGFGKPVLVTVTLPNDLAKKVRKDNYDDAMGMEEHSYKFRGNVPVAHITDIDRVRSKGEDVELHKNLYS